MKIPNCCALLIVALLAPIIQCSAMAADKQPRVTAIEKISQLFVVGTTTVPGVGKIEVAFSPKGGAEELIIKSIDSAQSEIKMLAYAFTWLCCTNTPTAGNFAP